MPKIPADIGLPPLQPGTDPTVSPSRSIIRSTANTLSTTDELIQNEKDEADRLGFLNSMSALEREVGEFMDGRQNDLKARGNAAAFEETFKKHPDAVVRGIPFSRRAQQQGNLKARATLNLARSKMNRLDFERNRLDAITTATTWIDSSSQLAARSGLELEEYEAQVDDELLKGSDTRTYDKNDEMVLKRLALGKYEHSVLTLMDQQGLYGPMEQRLKTTFTHMDPQVAANWRAKALAGKQRVAEADGTQQIVTQAEATSGNAFGDPILRPETRRRLATNAFTARSAIAMKSLVNGLRHLESGQRLEKQEVLDRAELDPDVTAEGLEILYGIANAEGEAERIRRIRAADTGADAALYEDKELQDELMSISVLNLAKYNKALAEGRPDAARELGHVSEPWVDIAVRTHTLRPEQGARLLNLLTPPKRREPTASELALQRRVGLIRAGQELNPTNPLDKKAGELFYRERMIEFLHGDVALFNSGQEDPKLKFEVGRFIFNEHGYMPDDVVAAIVGLSKSKDAQDQIEAGEMFSYFRNANRSGYSDGPFLAKGATVKELSLLKSQAAAALNRPADQRRAADLALAQSNQFTLEQPELGQRIATNVKLGLSQPTILASGEKAIMVGEQRFPVPDDVEPQGFIKLFHNRIGKRMDASSEADDPKALTLLEWIDDNLIRTGDIDVLVDRGHDDLDAFVVDLREHMRNGIRVHGDETTAADNAIHDLLLSGKYQLETVFSAPGKPRFTKFATRGTYSDFQLKYQESIPLRKWAWEDMNSVIMPGYARLFTEPHFLAQITSKGIELEAREPGYDKQVADFISKDPDGGFVADLQAWVYAGMDLGDPDVRENLAAMTMMSIDMADWTTGEGPQQAWHFIAGQTIQMLERNDMLVSAELRSYWQDGQGKDITQFHGARDALRTARANLEARGRWPVQWKPVPTQQPGQPYVYHPVFQSQSMPGNAPIEWLEEMRFDQTDQRWKGTGQPLGFELDPMGSTSVRRAIAMDQRFFLSEQAEAKGFYDGRHTRMADRFAKFPGLSTEAREDPALRKFLARDLANKTRNVEARDHGDPGDDDDLTLLERGYLRQIDAHLVTTTEIPQDQTQETIDRMSGYYNAMGRWVRDTADRITGGDLPRELQ